MLDCRRERLAEARGEVDEAGGGAPWSKRMLYNRCFMF